MRASLVAVPVCLFLTACGGGNAGGVASTPPPPAADTALTDLKSNDTFANVAVTGNASFPKSGAAPTNGIANAALTVSYDPGSKSYTIATAGRSQTFLPADVNAALSNGRIATYEKTSGSTTDSFTLTKPGTSGHNYQYVGGGYWQRTTDGASTLSGSLDAFSFGFKTPDAAVPKTGRAEFAVDLLGAETTASTVFGLTGQGLTQIDFTSGTIVTHGTFTAPISGQVIFSSEGKLTSNNNAFSGNFRFDDSGLFTGTITGALFGPQASEIGGAFSASQPDGRIAIGTIIGRGSSVTVTNASVAAPTDNEFFTNDAAELKATLTTGTGAFSGQSQAVAPLLVNYDATRQKYTLIADTRSQFFNILAQQNGTVADSLSFVAPATYQYVRGGEWRHAEGTGSVKQSAIDDFTYGVETPDGALPRTGSAGFAVQISGTAADGDYPNLVSFSGRGTATANFVSGQIDFTAGVHYLNEAPAGSALVGNGKFVASAMLSSAANLFSGGATLDGIGSYSGTAGSLNGRFYGPSASELGAAFHLSDGAGGVATGLIVGQQDANVLATLPSLATLSQLTTFDNSRYLLLGLGQPVVSTQSSLTYDPSNQTYTFNTAGNNLFPAQAAFGPGTRDALQSNASYTFYTVAPSAGNVSGSANILNSGSANPTIALTYTSFADINLTVTNGGTQISQFYYPFGVDTPSVQLPQYGTGTYDGIVYGKGRKFNNLTVQATPFTLSGNSHLVVDFAAATFSDSLAITGTDSVGNATPLNITITALGMIGSTGVMTGDFGAGNNGDYRGTFFGPKAAEYGAVFTYSQTVASTVPPSNITTSLNGVAVGKQSSFAP